MVFDTSSSIAVLLPEAKSEDEYGFFDILETDETTDCESAESSCKHSPKKDSTAVTPRSHLSSSSTLSAMTALDSIISTLSLISFKASTSDTIICEVSDSQAPLSCRYFDAEGRSVHISLDGFRVVQGLCREEAEYKVNMVVNGQLLSCWRKFSDFKFLADACVEYSSAVGMTHSHSPLHRTVAAWDKIESNRPWFSSISSPAFIASEMKLLKKFLSVVLFETPCFSLLDEFVRPK